MAKSLKEIILNRILNRDNKTCQICKRELQDNEMAKPLKVKVKEIKVCPVEGRNKKEKFLIEITFDNNEIVILTYQQIQEIIALHPERHKLLALQQQLEKQKK